MPDPTELAIIATFSLALGVFTVAAGAQKIRRKSIEQPPELPSLLDGASPDFNSSLDEIESRSRPGKIPTWFYQNTDLLGIGFIFLLFFGLVVSSLSGPEPAELKLDKATIIGAIGFQFIGAGIVTFFVISRIGIIEWLGLKWPSWPWIFLIAPGSVFFMWVVIAFLQLGGFMDWINSFGIDTVQDSVKLLQTTQDPQLLALMVFAAVVAAPMCEEIIFRGYLYPAAKKFTGPRVAGICSALVFTAAHGNMAALLPLFIFGCLLAFIYEKTASIWAPVAVHCCFNSATVIAQMIDRFHQLPVPPSP
jgi:membrane protease YdiL (CAAX protease family)